MWAADPETGEAGARPVTALIEGEGVKDLVTVSTASGSVVATVGHPFWSVSDAAWVDAGDLSVGDAVLQADGATSVVTEVVEVSRPAVVHNLTVADLHTYFVVVGDAPTLVHNSSCPLSLPEAGREPPWAGESLSRLTTQDEVFYRVWGGETGQMGRWLTPVRPSSAAAAADGLALPPGNTAAYVSTVRLPAGTRVQVGEAGPAFGRPGGWPQAEIMGRVPDDSFGPGELLR